MNQWLSSMNIDGGGRQYRLVREQSRRLSLCRLTFYRTMDEANPLQFTTKPWIAKQVTQIDRAQELAERVTAFVGRVALGSRTVQVEYRWWQRTIHR